MKILMVRPGPCPETIGLQHLMIVEPLELEILAALKREQDVVRIVDLIIEKNPLDFFIKEFVPDVLCITGYITNVSTIIEYCSAARQISNKIATIVGGVHCEVCPEDFEHPAIDFRVVRNAGVIFTDLLNHIDRQGALPEGVFIQGDTLENKSLPDFKFKTPMPDRSLVSQYRDKYFYIFHDKVALIKTSYGCPYQCSFCFCRIITSGKYHQRTVVDVIEELKLINETEIYIVDDDFLVDVTWLKAFVLAVKKHKLNKHYLVYGRADFIAKNPEMMHELAEIGLRTVIVGFESFSDNELDQYNKHTSVAMYGETMKVLQKEHIDVFATIIIPPHWDRSDFQNMVKVLKSLKIHYVNLQPLTPLPKTGVSFPEEDIILDKKLYPQWDLAHIAVRPTKLSVPDFYREIIKAYDKILFQPAVLWMYLKTYKPAMMLKMIVGTIRVARQYKEKIKEAKANHA